MEKHVKDEILNKVDELVILLKESPEYLRYKEIVEQMKKNDEIMMLIKNVKKNQKEIVNLEYRGSNTSNIENILFNSIETLNSYPIYQEYSYLLSDLNYMFQCVKNILEEYINDVLK